jgi:hypothetical protein
MANALYDHGREHFLDGTISWSGADIKAVLVTSGYTAGKDLTTDEYLAIIDAGWRLSTSSNLGAKDVAAGVADAGDVTFSAVTGTGVYVVLYKDSGDPATSPLIACIDTATGLPVVSAGGNVIVVWDSGANKIFKL